MPSEFFNQLKIYTIECDRFIEQNKQTKQFVIKFTHHRTLCTKSKMPIKLMNLVKSLIKN